MPRRFRILVVDDDPQLADSLETFLVDEGYDVAVAPDAESGLRVAYQFHPDAILLDVVMPGMGGFEMCQRLREITDVPIIFLSARGVIEDVVYGLSLGADDYVVKPFTGPELIGRLHACLRRASQRKSEDSDFLLTSSSVVLDCGRREAVVRDRAVYLAPKEFDILRLLIQRAGKVLSTDAILAEIWGPEWVGEPDLVKQYVYRLRRKIESDPKNPRLLHTVRGQGYLFDGDAPV